MPKLPKHLANYRGQQYRVESLRFKLRLIALMTMPRGSMKELCDALEISSTTLSATINTGYLPGELCIKLERIGGRVDFPRQWFNPELYEVAHQGA